MKKYYLKSIALITLAIMLFSTATYAQESEEITESDDAEAAALAKATQNPLAAMYSLPLQNNTTFDMGEFGRAQNVLNIQPVIPIGLGSKINLMALV